MSGRWFEELPVGFTVEHVTRRTVTETDNVLFTTMTMNPAPMHLDADYAAGTEFGRPLVNSMFTLALVVGLSVPELTLGTIVAQLGLGDVSFPAPVFAGDTIRVETEVVEAGAVQVPAPGTASSCSSTGPTTSVTSSCAGPGAPVSCTAARPRRSRDRADRGQRRRAGRPGRGAGRGRRRPLARQAAGPRPARGCCSTRARSWRTGCWPTRRRAALPADGVVTGVGRIDGRTWPSSPTTPR